MFLFRAGKTLFPLVFLRLKLPRILIPQQTITPIYIKTDLSDSAKGAFTATSVELINSYGKHNPTVYLTGRCKAEQAPVGAAVLKGLRYWVMIADNQRDNNGTPDIVGFAIHDGNGNRIAYGTGPLKGNITVAPK
jgi:hypothetical protein